ncbi:MAG: T9SS type A sorting domain-containing protein [Saprospiraceae bacterium]|nr:T9SS type A sorting domain-containing protein [Saprospiraceae bacterium]
MRYTFSVPSSLPLGTWEIRNGNSLLTDPVPNVRSINVNFSNERQYTVCYIYKDSQGCEVTCCRTICIVDPFSCNGISITQSGSNYLLNLPGISASNILKWENDNTGQQLGTGTSITFPIPLPGVCYVISVTYYDPSTGCYRVCCREICGPNCPPVNNNCDKISFGYTGTSGSLRYQFNIPTNEPSGRWIASGGAYGGSEVGMGQGYTVNFTFPSSGTYTICYEYTNQAGCKVRCCRKICVLDPLACDRIIVNQAQGGFNLSLNGVSASNVVQWINDSRNEVLQGTSSTFVASPPSGECYLISVVIYDPSTGCYQICCKQICAPADPCGIISNLETKCFGDNLDVSFTLNNTYENTSIALDATSNDFSMDFILLTPVGIGFSGCINVVTVNGILFGTQRIDLKLVGCTLALKPGDKVTIMPVLKQRIYDYVTICCHLDPIEIIIPECTVCQGAQQNINCSSVYQPVCGCNNVTYSNACYAQRDGVISWINGICNGDNLNDGNTIQKEEWKGAYTLTNSPNPFTSSTTIQFTLPESMIASISVMDRDGKILFHKTEIFNQGMNEVVFDRASQLPSGLYFYRLQTEEEILTKSMVLGNE